MTVTLFITLLTISATITSISTECLKKILDGMNFKYSSNLLVLINASIVGIGGTAVYYILNGMSFTVPNVVCMVLMGLASALGAMVGYDKVIQTIHQIVNS